MGPADPDAIRRYYDNIDAGDLEAVFELFADDVTYHRPGNEPLEGMDEFRWFYREGRPLSDGSHAVDAVVADGDTVAVRGRFEGRQDGERVAFGFADVHRFDDDGQVTERWTYTDTGDV
jgi:ketosteroid isomerase-like protein